MTELTTHQLTFSYAEHTVFEKVSLHLKPGEMLALLGANGAGKTTLLKTLARQLKPSSGEIFLDANPLCKMSRQGLAQQLAMMPQHENRDACLSVYDVVSLGRTPHSGWLMPLNKKDRSIIEDALVSTGLSDLRSRNMNEISGGEWRRMILARALAQDASVLLLDEPTAGLDLKYQYECLERVRSLTYDRKLVTVLTLHDLNQAAMFADRLALMSNRELIAIGPPEEVLTADHIRKAFSIEVTIMQHPLHGTPLVVPNPLIGHGTTAKGLGLQNQASPK